MNHWLMKTEPTTYSIDDLKGSPRKTDSWEGVRNYQARNFMRDEMKKGDAVLFYHSNCATPGVVGLATVVRESYPDHFALDKKSDYYDPKATEDNPRWFMVDIKHDKTFRRTVSLTEMKEASGLEKMRVLQKGNRLSITPVTKQEWDIVCALSSSDATSQG